MSETNEASPLAPLPILYQDEWLVAIDKPAGLLVHAGRDPEPPEMIAMKRLRDQLGRKVNPVHRLDRPTSGVLLFGLDSRTVGLAQQAFELRQVRKEYRAVVAGLPPGRWTCETPLQAGTDDEALPARTEFESLAVTRTGGFPGHPKLVLTLVRALPETGRFHQIRRHLLEAGHPIAGDFRYAGMERSFELGEILGTGTRMLLQAKRLELRHPHTGEWLVIEAPADPDFSRWFSGW